jgi:hypothetical protein
VPPKAIRPNPPHAQKAPVPRKNRGLRTSRLRRRRLGRVRLAPPKAIRQNRPRARTLAHRPNRGLSTNRLRRRRLGRVRLVPPKAIRPNLPHAQRTPVPRMSRGLRTNQLRRRRLGRVRLGRLKAMRPNPPHAQRTPVPRMNRRLRTNRLRRLRLGRVRLRRVRLNRVPQNRARQGQVSPLRSRKSLPHRRKRQARHRKRNPSDRSLIRMGRRGRCCLQLPALFLCKLALGRRSHRSTALAGLVRCRLGSAVNARREIFFCYNFLQPRAREDSILEEGWMLLRRLLPRAAVLRGARADFEIWKFEPECKAEQARPRSLR